mgnify:CR=1 FL=1
MYLAAYICLLVTLFCSLAGAAIGTAQLWQGRHSELRWLEYAQGLGSLCLLAASGVLMYALVVSDFSVDYVASYTDRALSLFYRCTAFWGGHEGSLMFWALMVSVCGTAFLFTRTYRSLSLETRSWFLVFFLAIMAFFGLLLSTWSNPFLITVPAPADGQGLNPLLQNPGMIFHPPLLFLGYGGFVIPGCLALAQAMSSEKDPMHWLDVARPFTLTGWLFLTAGIVLGGWWAYMELGWGGYWAWDPVENASLLPWLIGTAALHTGIVETRRGKLHRVNIFLMSLTTVSAFFATYLVRGDVVNSVHAFGGNGTGPYLLFFVLAFLVVITFISALAKDKSNRELGGLETREGFVVMTVWLLMALGISFSGPYKQEVELELARGGTAQVGPYTVTLSNLYEGRDATFEFIEAELQLSRDGSVVGTVSPQRRLYDKFPRYAFSEATTHPSLGSEFYATLLGVNGTKAVLRMSSNPLVNWLWIGGALMSLAPLLGLRRRRRPQDAADQPEGADN